MVGAAKGEHVRRHRRGTLTTGAVLAALVVGPLLLLTPGQQAWAGSSVTVRVVIENVSEEGCTDTLDGSDFYGRITLDGTEFNLPRNDDDDSLDPTDWK